VSEPPALVEINAFPGDDYASRWKNYEGRLSIKYILRPWLLVGPSFVGRE
jgi:hypothetical protein